MPAGQGPYISPPLQGKTGWAIRSRSRPVLSALAWLPWPLLSAWLCQRIPHRFSGICGRLEGGKIGSWGRNVPRIITGGKRIDRVLFDITWLSVLRPACYIIAGGWSRARSSWAQTNNINIALRCRKLLYFFILGYICHLLKRMALSYNGLRLCVVSWSWW